jgi:hypothetical protein
MSAPPGIFLIERLPNALWDAAIPGSPRRTIRMLAGHIHNARCMWIKTLGRLHGIAVPPAVDRYRVSRSQLIRALKRSSRGVVNLPLDVGHVLACFVTHEGAWSRATEETLGKLPGIISAAPHKSKDGTRVVNYAQWKTSEDWQQLVEVGRSSYFVEMGKFAKPDDQLYEVCYVLDKTQER